MKLKKSISICDIGKNALWLYNYLYENFGDTDYVPISYRGLANDVSMSVWEVRTAIKKLSEHHWIEVVSKEQLTHQPTQLPTHLPTQCSTLIKLNISISYKDCKNATHTPNRTPSHTVTHTPKQAEKIAYSEYVSLREKEYNSLVEKYGKSGADRMIEILGNYKGSSGKKYKEDYLAIQNWVIKRYEEESRVDRSDSRAIQKQEYTSQNLDF